MYRERSRSPVNPRGGAGRSNQVYIGQGAYECKESDVVDFFERQIGVTVDRVQLIMDRETGRARGFGFVTFTSPEMVNAAVSRANGCARALRLVRPRRLGGSRSASAI